MSRSLPDVIAANRSEEVRRAARALLRQPLLQARSSDADSFDLVRRHATVLRDWFATHTGWRLVLDTEVARLVKLVSGDPTFPARDPRTKTPFSRRRYVLACLALAALDRADAQITLGRLAEHLVVGAADPALANAGIRFTLSGREERTDLVVVVRLLLDLGALSKVAGDEDAFVRSTGDVLYDVSRRVIARLLAAPRGPSTIAVPDSAQRLRELIEPLVPDTEELRNLAIRHELTRRLLETPVVYYDELDEAQRHYLVRQRSRITRAIADFTGLVPEVRGEGIAMIDPDDDLTDVRMPEAGTEGHVTLLLAEHLAAQDAPVRTGDLHAKVRTLAIEHRAYWRKNAGDAGAEIELVDHALRRLHALRLISREGETVSARPALARYRIAAPTIRGSAQVRPPKTVSPPG